MIRRSFFGLASRRLRYPVAAKLDQVDVKDIPLPPRVTLFLDISDDAGEGLIIGAGQKVRTGQRLRLGEEGEGYLISPVTGTVSGIAQYTGYLGRNYHAISIDTADEDQWDEEFSLISGRIPTRDNAARFLGILPGAPRFASILEGSSPVSALVISGVDQDIMVTTNRRIMETGIEDVAEGVAALQKITTPARIIIAVPPDLASLAGRTGAEVRTVEPVYPKTLPRMIVKNLLGRTVLPGTALEEEGIGFINAEAAAALGRAFSKGEMPVHKMVTVIRKDHSSVHVRARIGTPVKEILDAFQIETRHGDRLVLGGPMTGLAVYDEDVPVMPDTDAVMIQDRDGIILNSDTQCVNCGECVRACPAKIPVNMLVRLLDNSLYEEAVERYDLLSCMECGLCSYVCIARIPVFQYIMLGKAEFSRLKDAEESNA
jgi:electron transport complex protein RnfC